jgi:hypothetical protein
MKAARAGQEPQHQEAAEHELEHAGDAPERERRDVREHLHGRKLEQLGHAELKEQKARDEPEQAEQIGLAGGGNAIDVHRFPPLARSLGCSDAEHGGGMDRSQSRQRLGMPGHDDVETSEALRDHCDCPAASGARQEKVRKTKAAQAARPLSLSGSGDA